MFFYLGTNKNLYFLPKQRTNDSMRSAFYPGAGTDLMPPILFPEITYWIYMDSLPRSESYVRTPFLSRLCTAMKQTGFELSSQQDNIYYFVHEQRGQTIQYETNGDLLDVNRDCDTLVLCGSSVRSMNNETIDSFSSIITNSITVHPIEREQLLCHRTVYTIMIDRQWEYWDSTKTISDIQKNCHIEPCFYTYDQIHSSFYVIRV